MTTLDNNATAEVGKDVASTIYLPSAPGAVGWAAAVTSVQSSFRMDESAYKVAAAVDQGVQGTKDGLAAQSSQSTVPTSILTAKSKRKARSKAKDRAAETPTSAGERPVASTLTSGSLPPVPPNSHPHYHHPYPPYSYPYYPVYYPPYPGVHPYPYPYEPHVPPALQSSGKPSRKKKKKGVVGKDKDVRGEMSCQEHEYGYGYGLG